jgi:uncharacterized protein (TIGR02996 family)
MTASADDLEAAIEAAIEDDSDDPTPFLVYADWLQSRGDPRGELIVFQHQGTTREADELLESQRELFLGSFATFAPERDGNTDKAASRSVLELEWELGFIQSAHIGWETYSRKRPDAVAAQLREFLALPSCRFLKHLKLGPIPASRTMDFRVLLDVLVEARRPRTLRTLFAGDRGRWDLADTAIGPIADVLATFPNLRNVSLQGGHVRIGAIAHAGLRGFGVQTTRLDRAGLDDICSAVWPRLDRLELTLGDGNCSLSDLAPLLSGANLPSLRHLALVQCGFADKLVAALPTSKLLARLASLDLSGGSLTDAGARTMATARLAFAHLDGLTLDGNAMTDAARTLVRGLAKRVVFGDQVSR